MYAEQATARRALPRLPPNSLRAHLPSDELPEEDEARSERSIPRQHPQYQSSYSEQILPYSSATRSAEPSDNATYVDEQQLSPSAEQPEPPEEPEMVDDVDVPPPPAERNANAALPHQESNASAPSEDVTGTEADDERDSLHEHKPLAASRSQPQQQTQTPPQQQLTRSHSGQEGGVSVGGGVEYEEFGPDDEQHEQLGQDEQWFADGDEQPKEYEEGSSAHGDGDIKRRRGNMQTQYRREMFRSFRDKHPSSSRSQQQPQAQRPERPPRYDHAHPPPHASRSLCDDAGVDQFEPEPEPESLNMEAARAADGEEALGSLGDREQFTPEPDASPQPPYENEEDLRSQQHPDMEPSTPTAEPDTLHERQRERQADGDDSLERIEYANVDGAEEQTEEVEAHADREWDGERSPAPLEDVEEAEFEHDDLEPIPDQPERPEEEQQPTDANKARLDEAEDEFPDDEQEAAGGGAAARWLAAFTKVCENLEVRALERVQVLHCSWCDGAFDHKH